MDDYTLVIDAKHHNFEEKVKNKMRNGYVPLGAPFREDLSDLTSGQARRPMKAFIQAMVKN